MYLVFGILYGNKFIFIFVVNNVIIIVRKYLSVCYLLCYSLNFLIYKFFLIK